MRIAVTGESGFIGKNLPKSIEKYGHEFVSLNNYVDFIVRRSRTDEPCVYSNSESVWIKALSALNVDCIIHNAAVVGTDVVAQNIEDSTLSNVAGTHNIVRASNYLNIPVVYTGTTVIYDTALYQDTEITEYSDMYPTTMYGCQKLASENIIKGMCKKWLIVRPLFAYGGIGDMNSLPAKTFYSLLKNKKNLDMFLDPKKSKDYLHVEDFCDGVLEAINLDYWQDDYNVSRCTPMITQEIVEMMSSIANRDCMDIIRWHPETDYLGNHRLTSRKLQSRCNWEPKYSLYTGLTSVWHEVNDKLDNSYNPLEYLESAKENDFDILSHFPKVNV
jgi:nucleoside-diphosphate-sugar epimerase